MAFILLSNFFPILLTNLQQFSAEVPSPTVGVTGDDTESTLMTLRDSTDKTTDVGGVTDPTIDSTDKTESPMKESTDVTLLETDESTEGVTEPSTEEPITMIELQEGECLKDQIVYSEGDEVPSTLPCQEKCNCRRGYIICEIQACPPSPPAFLKCAPIDQPDQCCPSYDCRK